jgi:hypothetical protein
VVDLMEALRRSVGGRTAETQEPMKPAKKSKKASTGQKEMLMPIAGKKPAKEAAAMFKTVGITLDQVSGRPTPNFRRRGPEPDSRNLVLTWPFASKQEASNGSGIIQDRRQCR